MPKGPELKVGLVFDDSLDSSDGVAQYVKTLGAWLSAQGHKVSYLVGETKLDSWAGGKVYSLAKNIRVVFNGNRLSIPLPAKRRRIKEISDAEMFDVLHIMMPHSPFMAQRVIKNAGKNVRVVGTFHIFPSGFIAKAGGRLLSLWYGRSLQRFSRIVSVSRPAQLYAKNTFGIETKIIPNPVDTARFSVPKTDRNRDIVFLGRLVKRKGCSQLIKAFAKLINSRPDTKLVIAGDGPRRRYLERLCRRLDISNSVQFLGYVEEAEKAPLLASAKIACFPSLYGESFGIVLIEAMAAGSRVVLGGDNPGYRSVLGAQPLLLIDPNDSQAFAERLKLLLDDAAKTAELHAWQDQAVGQYDIETVGRQILDLYNR